MTIPFCRKHKEPMEEVDDGLGGREWICRVCERDETAASAPEPMAPGRLELYAARTHDGRGLYISTHRLRRDPAGEFCMLDLGGLPALVFGWPDHAFVPLEPGQEARLVLTHTIEQGTAVPCYGVDMLRGKEHE